MRSSTGTALTLLAIASGSLAKTDIAGCTSSTVVVNGGASILYYVPGTGEVCAPLDCGGGRAPPKTTVPGCPQYSGTASYSPSYLPGYGPNSQPASTTSVPLASSAASVTQITPTLSAYGTDSSVSWVIATSSNAMAPVSSMNAVSSSLPLSTIITSGPTGIETLVVSPTATGPYGNLTIATTTRKPTVLSTGAATGMPMVGKDMMGLAIGVVAGLAML